MRQHHHVVAAAIGTYLLARGLTRSFWAPALASALVIVQPVVTRYSVRAEAPLYLAAFGALAMAAAVHARRRAWLWPVAGGLAGLANMSRSEGLLLIVVVLVAAAGASRPGRRLLNFAATLIGYVVAMLPVYVLSIRHLGTLMPSSGATFPFITSYQDLFALHVNQSASTVFSAPFRDVRLKALGDVFTAAFESLYGLDGVIVFALAGAAVVRALDREWHWNWRRAVASGWFVPVGFSAVTVVVYVLVAPVVASGGATDKGMAMVAPVLCVAAAGLLARLRFRLAVAAVAVVLTIAPLASLATETRYAIARGNAASEIYARLEPNLLAEQRCLGGQPLVLMTRNPWEFTQATGLRSVQTPNGSLADILAVAHRYQVTDIALDGQRSALADRTALLAPDGPLVRAPALVRHSIYRVRDLRVPAIC